MTSNRQDQEIGEGAVAVQAGRDVIVVQGLTYPEVRQVALDVVKSFYGELAGVAREKAQERIEVITDQVLDRLKDRPELLQQAVDPGFQRALHTVQVEYASTGDDDLGALLVDLLVDRAQEGARNMAQIVLNESINVAPKLTASQLATLAVMFMVRYTRANAGSLELLGEAFDKHVAPFVGMLARKESSFQHLQFAGCGSIVAFSRMEFASAIFSEYRGLFSLGFEESEIAALSLTQAEMTRLFTRCPNDLSKVQTKGLQKAELESDLDALKIGGELKAKVLDLFDRNPMPMDQVSERIRALRPYMAELMSAWDGSLMASFQLTSVGIAIGHANVKRVAGGEFSDLSIWVSE